MRARRLTAGDRDLARELFGVMASVFDEASDRLSDSYLDRLLGREDFWAIAAFSGSAIIGGVTAHTLPMTRSESSEIFIYDLAVKVEHQRQGVGRHLIASLRDAAAAAGVRGVLFVPADNADEQALAFYRALGGQPSPVTFFTFPLSTAE